MQTLFYFINDLSLFTVIIVTIGINGLLVGIILIVDFSDYRYKKERNRAITSTQAQLIVFSLILYGFNIGWLFCNTGTTDLFSYGVVSQLNLGGVFTSGVFLLSIIGLLSSVIRQLGANLEELILYLILGLIGPVFFTTAHLIGFFVGLESISFSFYILVGLSGTLLSRQHGQKYNEANRSLEAALRYMIPGLFSSLLIVLGLLIIYLYIPTLDIGQLLVVLRYDMMFLSHTVFGLEFGITCVVSSFLFKLTAAPFHRWVFGVYSGASLYVVFLIATVAKLMYFTGFVRWVWPLIETAHLVPLLITAGLLSVIVGTVHGVYEQRFTLVLACSGILNIGYALVGLALGGQIGVTLSLFSLFIYVGLLLGIAIIVHLPVQRIVALTNVKNITELGEGRLGGESSITLGLTLLAFALIGVPPLIGFFPKFFTFINLVLNYPLLISWGFLLGVVVSAFMYFRWIIALLVSTVHSNVTLTWSTWHTSLLVSFVLLLFSWGILVDWSLTIAALCGIGP